MGNAPRMTTSVLRVISALLVDPATERYGLELIADTGLASGTLYPILVRLERAGWVESYWEEIDPVAQGRPSRRYYRLTPTGVADARREIAILHQQLTRAGAGGARGIAAAGTAAGGGAAGGAAAGGAAAGGAVAGAARPAAKAAPA